MTLNPDALMRAAELMTRLGYGGHQSRVDARQIVTAYLDALPEPEVTEEMTNAAREAWLNTPGIDWEEICRAVLRHVPPRVGLTEDQKSAIWLAIAALKGAWQTTAARCVAEAFPELALPVTTDGAKPLPPRPPLDEGQKYAVRYAYEQLRRYDDKHGPRGLAQAFPDVVPMPAPDPESQPPSPEPDLAKLAELAALYGNNDRAAFFTAFAADKRREREADAEVVAAIQEYLGERTNKSVREIWIALARRFGTTP